MRVAWGGILACCTAGVASADPSVGSQVVLSSQPTATIWPVIAGDPAHGKFLTAWTDQRNGKSEIWGRLVDASGNPLGADFPIATSLAQQCNPGICACGPDFLVTFGNAATASQITDIHAQRIDATGALIGGPFAITTDPGKQHLARHPAFDGVDTVLVAWTDNTSGQKIFYTRVRFSTGTVLDGTGAGLRLDDGSGFRKNAYVSFGAGLFFVTWDDQEFGCTYGGESGCIDILGAMIDPGTGAVVVPRFPVTRAFSCQEGSKSAFDGTNFVVTLNDERFTNCSTSDVFAVRVTPGGFVLDPSGALIGDPTGLNGGILVADDPTGLPVSAQLPKGIAFDGMSYLITYTDHSYSPLRLLARRVRTDGTPLDCITPVDPGWLVDDSVSEALSLVATGPGTWLSVHRTSGGSVTNAVLRRISFAGGAAASVAGRWAFYDDSSFDGNTSGASPLDDGARAKNPDGSYKAALLPGGTATTANITSYSKGLNGIMIDVCGMPGVPSLADLELRTGGSAGAASADVSTWGAPIAPPAGTAVAFALGAGVGGTDRITITFPDGAIKRTWLEVVLKANATTGLTDMGGGAGDRFYFGNAVGDTLNGISSGCFLVQSSDALATHAAAGPGPAYSVAAPITSAHDHDRDGFVTSSTTSPFTGTDRGVSATNLTSATNGLRVITAP
jgi:hypothetical protein